MLPPVYSTTVPPGFSRPSASAHEITASAMRSFMLPVGFSHSSFARTAAQSGGTTRFKRTNDVPPTALRTSSAPAPAAGDRRSLVREAAKVVPRT